MKPMVIAHSFLMKFAKIFMRRIKLQGLQSIPWGGGTSLSLSAVCSWAVSLTSQRYTADLAEAFLAAGPGSGMRTDDFLAETAAAGSPGMWPAGASLTLRQWAGLASSLCHRCPIDTHSYTRLAPTLQIILSINQFNYFITYTHLLHPRFPSVEKIIYYTYT